ncbi:MAG: hypothetical protein PHN78_04405, partial [Dehalococcoidales bacterium]|nr:hypothetical protein [Dehalococcoidales bacterium]
LVSKLPSIANVSGIPIIGELATISRLDLWALAVSAILLFLVSLIDNGINRHPRSAAIPVNRKEG